MRQGGPLEGCLKHGAKAGLFGTLIKHKVTQGISHHSARGEGLNWLDQMRMIADDEVGPGGHFFGAAHTMARYRNAFYAPMISDWRNYESWTEAGKPDAYDAANRLYKSTLAGYQAPAIDPAVKEELTAFVARRKAEGGVPTDF